MGFINKIGALFGLTAAVAATFPAASPVGPEAGPPEFTGGRVYRVGTPPLPRAVKLSRRYRQRGIVWLAKRVRRAEARGDVLSARVALGVIEDRMNRVLAYGN